MFETLSDRLSGVFGKLTRQGALTDEDISTAMREVRTALLEADVSLPVARSFVSIPAGVFEARLGRYTVLTAIGSTLWCIAFASVGYAFGTRWETFHENFHYVDYAVAGGIVLALAYLVVRRRRAGSLSRRATDPAR